MAGVAVCTGRWRRRELDAFYGLRVLSDCQGAGMFASKDEVRFTTMKQRVDAIERGEFTSTKLEIAKDFCICDR